MPKKEKNSHDHDHDHNHGPLPIILYLIGLVTFFVGMFITNELFANILFTITVLGSGYHVMEDGLISTITETRKRKRFSPNVHLLMALAAVGAMIIGDFKEGALLILIFAGAHFLEEYAEDRSKREITNLLKLNPTEGRLIQEDGSIKVVSAQELKIGDKLQVLVGDQIPTDGIILEGRSSIEEASITGESIPKEKTTGDEVYGSTINGKGAFVMEVTKNPDETVFSKILELVNQSQTSLSKTATRIKQVEPIYVTLILVLFPLYILFGNYVLNWGWDLALYRGMVFLTVTSPCALAAADVPATLSAISNLARHGVLFKGGSFIANLGVVNAVAFDKTGTLTKGEPQVTDVEFADDITDAQKDTYIDIIVAIEKQANHPLGDAIIKHFTVKEDLKLVADNIIGTGIVSTYDGVEYQIGKPTSFENVTQEIKDLTDMHSNEGKTVVYFGTKDKVLALVSMMDIASDSAVGLINYLNSENIATVMITGDATLTAKAVSRNIGITDVKAEVHPEDKAMIIKELQKKYGLVAMLGDGINDAPALVNADIGVAMGYGTDVAIDVADAVLMKNDMSNFKYAHKVSKRLNKVVMQNVIFSMFVVILLVVLNTIGQMSLPLGVLFHEGSTIIVILNGLRLLKKLD